MSIFKRKIKNTFDVARDMGVDEEKIKELKEGERQVEGATMDKVLQSVNKSQVERDIEKLNIFEWYNNTDLKALIKNVKDIILITGIRICLLYKFAIEGAKKNITIYNIKATNMLVCNTVE